MNNENAEKVCPLRLNDRDYTARLKCIGEGCSWWCNFADSCSIPLLAGMFADSSICRSVFDSCDDFSCDDLTGVF